jgi:membrane protein
VARSDAGRNADSPAQIPARGWWAVLKRVFAGFNDDRLMTEAAGVTFYTLLAIFPAIATLVSLYGFFADPSAVNDHLQTLSGIVPAGGMDLIAAQVKALTANGRQALGLGVLIGLLTSMWSSNQGMKGLFDALNVVYHEKEKRSFLRRTLITLGFTVGAIVFIILAMSAVVLVPIVMTFLGFGDWTTLLLAAARWPLLMVLLGLFLAVVYRFGPSRTHAKWRWVSWGSAFASITWLLASIGFSYYVANFGSYNKTYGSLGAAIGFMTWIWISTIIVLLGGELNAELEQQTHRDSTVGKPKPMGLRGAYKADVKP